MARLPALLLLSLLAAEDAALEPFERGGRWGYREHHGRVVISPHYDQAYAFVGAVAPVADERGWIWIDRRGRLKAHALVVDNGPDPFSQGLTRIVEGGKVGYLDRSGRVAIPPRLDFARPFHDGRAAFCEGCAAERDGEHTVYRGGRWGYLDQRGKVAIPAQFDFVDDFHHEAAQVEADGQTWKISPDGKALSAKAPPR